MMRDFIGRAFISGLAAALFLLLLPAAGCGADELELIAPGPGGTLQFKTDDFLVFFSPEVEEAGLEGLRLSLTNTSGNTLSIDWSESYFVLPTGQRSDVVTDDVPASFQMNPTQIPIRQTTEIVAVPLGNISHSESGWSVGPIDVEDGSEFTLHLAVKSAGNGATDGYGFTFRVAEPVPGVGARTDVRLPVWSALLALGIGFLLGLLLSAS